MSGRFICEYCDTEWGDEPFPTVAMFLGVCRECFEFKNPFMVEVDI